MNKNTIFYMDGKLYRIVSTFGRYINYRQIEYYNLRSKYNTPIFQAEVL